MKLYEQFLKETNLEKANVIEKALACACLKSVVCEPQNKSIYGSLVDSEFFPEECQNLAGLVPLVTTFDYWGNDLAYILSDTLAKEHIDSPLNSDIKGVFNYIFNFLDNILRRI